MKKKFFKKCLLIKKNNNITSFLLDSIELKYKLNYKLPHPEIDCILSGGAFKGFYLFGAIEILKKIIKDNKINIRYFIGTSIGAFVAVSTVLNLSFHTAKNVYEFCKKNKKNFDLNDILLYVINHYLPENGHLLCNGKVKIVLSELTYYGLKETIIDHFESREHLIQVLNASTCIPIFSDSKFNGVKINGKIYYDGGFTNNNPIQKNNKIPQLVFYTLDIDYPLSYMYELNDKSPELLILKGAIEMEKFINNYPIQKNNIPIKYYLPCDLNINKNFNIFNYIFICSALIFFIIKKIFYDLINKLFIKS